MRIVAWNVGHREVAITGKPKWSAKQLVDALDGLRADVLFLHEYHRPKEEDQQEEDALLSRAGFECVRRTPVAQPTNDNQTLVASRDPSLQIMPSAADGAPVWALHNYLHVALSGVELIGLRVPDYRKVPKGLQNHRDWLDRTLEPLVTRRIIVLGDVNADPADKKQRELFIRMKKAGWCTKDPSGTWSFKKRTRREDGLEHRETRIDHAFFGKGFELDDVHIEYVPSSGNHKYTGPISAGISDHATLLVNIPRL